MAWCFLGQKATQPSPVSLCDIGAHGDAAWVPGSYHLLLLQQAYPFVLSGTSVCRQQSGIRLTAQAGAGAQHRGNSAVEGVGIYKSFVWSR